MATNRVDILRQTQTSETDTTKRLAPNGSGGVAWGTGGSGSGVAVVIQLTNKSGASVAAGDVVIADTTNDSAFTTTTTAGVTKPVGIAQATIANNATGSVAVQGHVALVNVPSSQTRGQYLATHTVAKQATGAASRVAGSFGYLETGGTTPAAYLFGIPDLSFTNPMTTAADLIVGGTSGVPARLAKGSDSQVLTVDPTTHLLVWATPSSGFSNPMTTKGDVIVADTGGTALRKAVGTDGEVLTADAASTGGIKWAAASGGGGWDLNLDQDGSSFTGWSGLTGTWASTGTIIQQTNGAGAYSAVRSGQVVDFSYFVAECEIRFPTSGQPSAPNYAGIVLGMPSTDPDSMMNVSLTRNTPGEVRFDNYGHTNMIAASATVALDTWYVLRCVASAGNFAAYLDGVLKGTAHSNYSNTNYNVSYIGLRTNLAKADFRNIKVWNPTLP